MLKSLLSQQESEVDLAVGAQASLKDEGIHARVVSMACTQAFDRQDQAYKDSVLTPGVKRISVEAGVDRLLEKVCRSWTVPVLV